MNELDTARIAHEIGANHTLVSEIATRLQLVRGDLTDDGFAALVRNIVRTKVSFAERDAREDLTLIRSRTRDD